jgi:hypothetical protein
MDAEMSPDERLEERNMFVLISLFLLFAAAAASAQQPVLLGRVVDPHGMRAHRANYGEFLSVQRAEGCGRAHSILCQRDVCLSMGKNRSESCNSGGRLPDHKNS